MPQPQSTRLLLALCVLSFGGLFVVDVITPSGPADWILYLIPLVATLWLPPPRLPILFAAVGTALLMLAAIASRPEVSLATTAINRAVGALVLWTTALSITARRTASALRNSERRFRALIERSVDLVAIVGADGAYRYANPAHESVSGFRPDELVGKQAFDLLHADDVPDLSRKLAEAIQTGLAAATIEYRLRHKDGSWHAFEGIAINLLDDPGVNGILITGRDMTEHKRVAAALQEDAAAAAALSRVGQEIVSSLATPRLLERLCRITTEVLECDASYTLLWQPRENAYAVVAGYGHASEEERESLQALRLPAEAIAGMAAQLADDAVVQITMATPATPWAALPARFGITVALYAPLRRAGTLVGVHAAAFRGRHARFGKHHERIARGIAQIASIALENARLFEELEHANRLKSEFVATMSHELRTPLNIIIGYTELMGEKMLGPLTNEQEDTVRRLDITAQKLLDLINATLNVSRLEAGQWPLDLTRVSVPDLIDTLRHDAHVSWDNPEVAWAWNVAPDLPPLQTDAVKLKVVLTNLVNNAVKFTAAGHITVEVHARDHGVEFSVSDTGIGIAPEILSVIFERFRQGDNSVKRGFGGVGLGLYIVRRLVDLLAGTVSVDSEVNRGSTFRVWLPAEASTTEIVGELRQREERALADSNSRPSDS